jgi:uncharacterized protein YdaT
MNGKLFAKLCESLQELNDMQVENDADHVSALVSEGKEPNQAMAIALQKAKKLRKDKGRQKSKQKGKQYRG